VVSTSHPDATNALLLEKKIIGGLPLGRFYPELSEAMLLCATEMSRRADMDTVAHALLRAAPALLTAPVPEGL